MKRLLGIAGDYPSRDDPGCMPQIRGLFESIAARKIETSLLVPRPVWRGAVEELSTEVTIERPRYVSFSSQWLGRGVSTFGLTVQSFRWSILRAARHVDPPPDAVLGYFAFPAGFAALTLGRYWNVPAVVSLGESSMGYYERHVGIERLRRTLRSFSGVLCLCEERRRYCRDRLGIDERRLTVIPNAADPTVFYPRDRARMRKELGLPPDRPIVITVGWFGRRKGTNRVLRALQSKSGVGGVFLGKGPTTPAGPKVLHVGSEAPVGVARWLAAADLFALPTHAEGGGPNAVVEAMAVGLPLVVSDIPGMRQVAGEEAAVFLRDPDDANEIAEAIRHVLETPGLAERMGRAALDRARAFTLQDRVDRLTEWIERLEPVPRSS